MGSLSFIRKLIPPQFLFQVLVASARLELQLRVEFEKVVVWSHEVKIGDLLEVDLACIYYISVDQDIWVGDFCKPLRLDWFEFRFYVGFYFGGLRWIVDFNEKFLSSFIIFALLVKPVLA